MSYTYNPLGLYKYNKILVGYLPIHPCLFIYHFLDYSSHLQHFYQLLHAIFSPPSSFLSYLIKAYSLDGKRQNLQCQRPWLQQCHESTTSQLVVGHVDLAFRGHGAKATC
jgi:hypothetical protein